MALTDTEIAALRIQMAQQEIASVVYKLARSIDRMDKPLLQSCFHDDATDDHGLFKGTAADFCDWVMEELKKFERTQHFIGNMLVTVDGDKAACESYFIAHHVISMPENKMDMLAAGRYLDTFEQREGAWKITHRHAVYDWNRADGSSDTWNDPAIAAILERGARGADDMSYGVLGALV